MTVIPVMIVPVLQFYDKLQVMLDGIDYPVGHIIIIDNGGKLTGVNCPLAKRISIINMPRNLGVPSAWNLGIQLEPFAKYWLFSQDDITWVSGGLARIHELSGEDILTMDMVHARPFSTFSVGEDVIRRVGLFDESYFPLLGDDFNFHKRCHAYSIREEDISGTFIAEKSATIKSMLNTGKTSHAVLIDNYLRSVYGPPQNSGWSLLRRRRQGVGLAPEPPEWFGNEIDLDSEYVVHNDHENKAFTQSIVFGNGF